MFSQIVAIMALLDNRAQRKLRWNLEASKRAGGDWRYCGCRLCSDVRDGRVWVNTTVPIVTTEDPRVSEFRNLILEMDK
jgi:hypothetical protein